jgi:hypothetical protein
MLALITTTYTAYEMIKWWLPILSFGGIIVKAYLTAKKNISDYADRLLSNHLVHIEEATKSTEVETKTTNKLLTDVYGQNMMVLNTINQHQEKQMLVWDGVVKTLAILEDRGSRRARVRKK